EGDLMNEEAMYSLIKIGTDRTAEVLCADWHSAPEHYKLYASSALQNIHSDLAASRCLDLQAQEGDRDLKVRLLRAALGSFCLDGIEPARQLILQERWDLHQELLAVALLAGVEFPELEQWKAEEYEAVEERRRRRGNWLAPASQGRSQSQRLPAFSALADPAPVLPVTRKEQAGRNDPCPCGSGKKFKKCCLGKEA
ncbi:MAG: SEC-C domain-containing protein, partial [Planctomycetales bacterium]|nr:SEC-C domain-containing protein [Planctomycetales bacterium]